MRYEKNLQVKLNCVVFISSIYLDKYNTYNNGRDSLALYLETRQRVKAKFEQSQMACNKYYTTNYSAF